MFTVRGTNSSRCIPGFLIAFFWKEKTNKN